MVGQLADEPNGQSQHGMYNFLIPSVQCVSVPTIVFLKGRNNAIKLLKLDLPLMGPEAVMDGLTRQL